MLQTSQDYLGYHISPEYGLLNDPNGLINYQGIYHVFYQVNTEGFTHSNKSWGHVYSDDMINWQRAEIALRPDSWFDQDGVYSGSAIEYEGKLYLFYTGNVIKNGVNKSYQCIAVSEDGFRFKKLGPIIDHPAGYTRHVRDPKIFKSPFQDSEWYLFLGAQTVDLKGDILVYRSKDLLNWEQVSKLSETNNYDFGYMLECPDMIEIDGQFALICSPQGLTKEEYRFRNRYQSGYFLCDFSEDGSIALESDFRELDQGFEFYAPQTFRTSDRNILYAWMGVMEDEKEAAVPTIQSAGWLHHLSIPREIKLVENKLVQQPVKELEQLRFDQTAINETFRDTTSQKLDSLQTEVLIDFSNGCEEFTISLDGGFDFSFSKEAGLLVLRRECWLTKEIEERKIKFSQPINKLQLFLDHSALELFINDGKRIFSSRFFPQGEANCLKLQAENTNGRLQIFNLKTIDLHSQQNLAVKGVINGNF